MIEAGIGQRSKCMSTIRTIRLTICYSLAIEAGLLATTLKMPSVDSIVVMPADCAAYTVANHRSTCGDWLCVWWQQGPASQRVWARSMAP